MTLELSKRNICHNLDDEVICTVFKLFSKYDLTMNVNCNLLNTDKRNFKMINNINKSPFILNNYNIQTKDLNCISQCFSQNTSINNVINVYNVLYSKNDTVVDKNCCKNVTYNTFSYSNIDLHIAHINIQHILNKLDEIKYHLSQLNSSHILGLCETFLTEKVQNNDLFINNFSFERKDRVGKKGGGILIYIASKVPYIRRLDLEHNDIESICIQITYPNVKPFLLNFVYRPPDAKQSWINIFETVLDKIDLLNCEMHTLGDININFNKDSNPNNFKNTK